MTWHIFDSEGNVLADFSSFIEGEIGASSLPITLYAGVVDYISGTIVWNLSWNETIPGQAPAIVAAPAGKVGIVFQNPSDVGAQGIATLTATVNGLVAGNVLQVIVATNFFAGIRDIGWFSI